MFSTQLVNCCPHGRRNYNCILLPLSLLSDLPPPPSQTNCTYSILLGAHELRARRTICKSIFFKDINCWRTIRGLSRLKEPWSRRFGTLPVERKLLKNDSEHMYEAQAVLDKFFDAGHYMKKHDPSLPVEGRFYGWGKRTQAQTTASKSGMTLTNREV